MIIVWILSIMGLAVWSTGFILAIISLTDKSEQWPDRIKYAFGSIVVCAGIGLVLNLSGILCPIKGIVTNHYIPTSIVKTNNFTFVNFITNGHCVVRDVNESAEYWNATNIMIEVDNGKNFFNYETSGNYKVVLH